MTQTMKAAVVCAFGKPLTIEDVPVPTPGPGKIEGRMVLDFSGGAPVKSVKPVAEMA